MWLENLNALILDMMSFETHKTHITIKDLLAGAKRQALQVGWSQEARHGAEN